MHELSSFRKWCWIIYKYSGVTKLDKTIFIKLGNEYTWLLVLWWGTADGWAGKEEGGGIKVKGEEGGGIREAGVTWNEFEGGIREERDAVGWEGGGGISCPSLSVFLPVSVGALYNNSFSFEIPWQNQYLDPDPRAKVDRIHNIKTVKTWGNLWSSARIYMDS